MDGYEIIQTLESLISEDDIIVSSNGNISRQVYHFLHRPQIYLRGSMGLPISVGFGVALAREEKRVLVILGDGNMLMGFSSLVTASFIHPKNLKIIILDNNEYATTGHQETSSSVLNYGSLFEGMGIPYLEPIPLHATKDEAKEKLQNLMESENLCILSARVTSNPPSLENIPLHPEEITSFQRK